MITRISQESCNQKCFFFKDIDLFTVLLAKEQLFLKHFYFPRISNCTKTREILVKQGDMKGHMRERVKTRLINCPGKLISSLIQN